MRGLLVRRHTAAIICLTAFLVLALAVPTFGLLALFLIPFWLCLEAATVSLVVPTDDSLLSLLPRALAVFSPRPPPSR